MLRRERRVIGALVSRAHSGNAVLRPHPALDCGLRLSNTGDWAAPFEKHHVTPPAIHAANPLPPSHNSKPGPPAQGETRGVLWKDTRLKRPDSRALGRLHDGQEVEVYTPSLIRVPDAWTIMALSGTWARFPPSGDWPPSTPRGIWAIPEPELMSSNPRTEPSCLA